MDDDKLLITILEVVQELEKNYILKFIEKYNIKLKRISLPQRKAFTYQSTDNYYIVINENLPKRLQRMYFKRMLKKLIRKEDALNSAKKKASPLS